MQHTNLNKLTLDNVDDFITLVEKADNPTVVLAKEQSTQQYLGVWAIIELAGRDFVIKRAFDVPTTKYTSKKDVISALINLDVDPEVITEFKKIKVSSSHLIEQFNEDDSEGNTKSVRKTVTQSNFPQLEFKVGENTALLELAHGYYYLKLKRDAEIAEREVKTIRETLTDVLIVTEATNSNGHYSTSFAF